MRRISHQRFLVVHYNKDPDENLNMADEAAYQNDLEKLILQLDAGPEGSLPKKN